MSRKRSTTKKKCVTCGEEFQAIDGFDDENEECYSCRAKRSDKRWSSGRKSVSSQRP